MALEPYIGETTYYPLTKEKHTLYGSKELIESAIKEYDTCDKKGKGCMKGTFGSVYKVSISQKEYYIKRLEYTSNILHKTFNIYAEISIAIELTRRIPSYISKLEASIIFEKAEYVSAYLIFEGLPGISLLEFLKNNNPTERKNIPIYESIYCSLKEAQLAINNAGYVHRDIKPANIFVVHERSGIFRCKLIDFGLTVPIGTEGTSAGTVAYMPPSLLTKKRPANKSQNDHSVKTIWHMDFLFKGPPPNCTAKASGLPLPPPYNNNNNNNDSSGGKRLYRKTRRRNTRRRAL